MSEKDKEICEYCDNFTEWVVFGFTIKKDMKMRTYYVCDDCLSEKIYSFRYSFAWFRVDTYAYWKSNN